MQKVKPHFMKYTGRGWLCIKDVDLDGPQGRIQVSEGTAFMPGTIFMGVNITDWLEGEIEKEDAADSLLTRTSSG